MSQRSLDKGQFTSLPSVKLNTERMLFWTPEYLASHVFCIQAFKLQLLRPLNLYAALRCRDAMLKQVPQFDGTYIRVPRIWNE